VPLSAYSNRGWVGFRYVCAGASSGLLAASGRLAGSRYGRGLNAAHHLTVFNAPSSRARIFGDQRSYSPLLP
jgi:hypothetical protein